MLEALPPDITVVVVVVMPGVWFVVVIVDVDVWLLTTKGTPSSV